MKDFKIITSNVWTTTREKKQAVVFNGNAGRDNTIPLVSQSKASYRDNLATGTEQCAFKKSILPPLIHRRDISGRDQGVESQHRWLENLVRGQSFGRDGAVVRALASHQCGPGSTSRSGAICGLSLLVLYCAPRGFHWVLRFPFSSNLT